ncbi:hypothetical protein F751_2144 [Auxenochlorella protothecoides]|uniref:Uncharacterized protein n=1 Tax=Auxenochlorella protothecoides TaxID=3075 RepID=A0A087SLF3_AUXPR|nr:hypothetical protein F751_2144 [Auxenochlorella protothecoides]KFM26557.1 hypothetical protein F751_2144 [Auxenochlorella protothecoides]
MPTNSWSPAAMSTGTPLPRQNPPLIYNPSTKPSGAHLHLRGLLLPRPGDEGQRRTQDLSRGMHVVAQQAQRKQRAVSDLHVGVGGAGGQ